MGLLTFIVLLIALLAPPAQGQAGAPAARESRVPSRAVLGRALEAACLGRMEELGALEKEQRANTNWEITPVAVRGTYVGYAPNFTCNLGQTSSSVPTATFRYQEVQYRKSGKTLAAAEADTPKPTEISEVTEVLSYRDGAWR